MCGWRAYVSIDLYMFSLEEVWEKGRERERREAREGERGRERKGKEGKGYKIRELKRRD